MIEGINKKVVAEFKPPIVEAKEQGLGAFHAYDWYFELMRTRMKSVEKVFLVPCATVKPIDQAPLHRRIYQKFAAVYALDREMLVVSEPAVLISYDDLRRSRPCFLYEFPPRYLGKEARELFVGRLRELLTGKNILACLPSHHAKLVTDAVGNGWPNYWEGDMLHMYKKASELKI